MPPKRQRNLNTVVNPRPLKRLKSIPPGFASLPQTVLNQITRKLIQSTGYNKTPVYNYFVASKATRGSVKRTVSNIQKEREERRQREEEQRIRQTALAKKAYFNSFVTGLNTRNRAAWNEAWNTNKNKSQYRDLVKIVDEAIDIMDTITGFIDTHLKTSLPIDGMYKLKNKWDRVVAESITSIVTAAMNTVQQAYPHWRRFGNDETIEEGFVRYAGTYTARVTFDWESLENMYGFSDRGIHTFRGYGSDFLKCELCIDNVRYMNIVSKHPKKFPRVNPEINRSSQHIFEVGTYDYNNRPRFKPEALDPIAHLIALALKRQEHIRLIYDGSTLPRLWFMYFKHKYPTLQLTRD